MRKIVIISIFFLTFNLFSQNQEKEHIRKYVPSSIFVTSSSDFDQPYMIGFTETLNLTNFTFLIEDNRVTYNFMMDFRNLGRKITIDDLTDNYQKSELIKYFFKGYNMWDISLQKQNNQKNN